MQALVGRTPKTYFHEFWALRDISFEINKGETVGIVGRNGSGKSTLLQLICGTLTPTSGKVMTNGRIAALLELGSGFNPEFTGRENVYLNGAILGLSKYEIDNRFNDIAAFADIGEFIEQPVKMYSSGMYVRLAFAVNVMSQPDIMIIDEALAVGDMMFQAKCMTALKRRQDEGTSVLFVSHDINSVKSLCSRAIYLEQGKMKSIGPASEVGNQFIRAMRTGMNEELGNLPRALQDSSNQNITKQKNNREPSSNTAQYHDADVLQDFERHASLFRQGTGEARITYVELLDSSNEVVNVVEFNQNIKLRIFFEAYQAKSLSASFGLVDSKKNNVTGSNLLLATQSLLDVFPGDIYMVEYSLRLPLQDGIYSIQTSLVEPVVADQVSKFIDVIDDSVVFEVTKWAVSRVWHKVYLFPSVKIISLGKSQK